jgi:hypothetical protein
MHKKHVEKKQIEIKHFTRVDGALKSYEDVRTILSWHAPGRPFRHHSKEYFINLFLITVAIEVIVFLFHLELLMLVILSLAFLAFTMAIVPPHMFFYKITSEGIRIEDSFFLWDELYDFYITKHNGMDVVRVSTETYFPGELTLNVSEVAVQDIKSALIKFLPFREYVKPTMVQRAGDWLERNFPLEKALHDGVKK